jgi:DNA-binding transcriptional ArsR family regulator
VAKSRDVAKTLRLLANEKRLLILCKLATEGDCTVSCLADSVGLSQSALSQHLAKLRRDGLVTFWRNAQALHYAIDNRQLEQLLVALKEIYCPELASKQRGSASL